MRYVTFEHQGQDHLGAVSGDWVLDLAGLSRLEGAPEFPDTMLGLIQAGSRVQQRARDLVAAQAGREAELGRTGLAVPLAEARLLAPIPHPSRNVFCLGLNYAEHVAEGARARGREAKLPEWPVYFTKATHAVCGPEAPLPWDEEITSQLDWEAELGVVLGRGGRDIGEDEALSYVFGYTCINDVSARDLQQRHNQWHKGKSLDNTCPMGPWIVTADELPDPQVLDIACRVNGVTKQDSNTRHMIFPVARCISVLSRGMTLDAGDVIATGTPSGVGLGRTPPEYLKPGDVVEVDIERIGVLRNPVGIPAAVPR